MSLRSDDYTPTLIKKTYRTYKRPLVTEIPSDLTDIEKERLQVMIYHSKKRPLLRMWPTTTI